MLHVQFLDTSRDTSLLLLFSRLCGATFQIKTRELSQRTKGTNGYEGAVMLHVDSKGFVRYWQEICQARERFDKQETLAKQHSNLMTPLET